MSEWKDCVLANVCHYVKDRRSTDGLTVDNYISTENLLPNKGGYTTASSVPEGVQVTDFCKGDVLVSNIRPYFKKIWQATFDSGCSNDVLVFRAEDGVDPRWLNYVLANDRFFDHCMAGAKGCKMPRGDKQQIMEYPVNLPDLPTQRKIAAVLGALDDKIELNRRMNANLEATVQALFKSWFVDFEPFGGVMPKEWGRSDVYGLAEIIYGAPFKSNLFNEKREGRPIIRIRDLKENATDTFTTEHHPKELLVHAGDIVVGMDGEFRPYIWGNYDVLLNQRLCVFKPLNPADRAFLYFTLKPLLMAVEKTQVATTVIHIGKGDFDRFEILMPPRKTLDEFAAMAEPLVQKTVVGRVQIHTLAQLRDALLPKVISGELSADGVKVD